MLRKCVLIVYVDKSINVGLKVARVFRKEYEKKTKRKQAASLRIDYNVGEKVPEEETCVQNKKSRDDGRDLDEVLSSLWHLS